MKLYVVRHGQTDNNVHDKINGRKDYALNAVGLMQAQELTYLISNLNIDYIISSPLKMAKRTAEIISNKRLEIKFDDRLTDRDAKSMCDKNTLELNKDVWYSVDSDIVYKDSESFRKIVIRVKKFISSIRNENKDKTILIVTHEDVIRAIDCLFNGYDKEKLKSMSVKNCELREYNL